MSMKFIERVEVASATNAIEITDIPQDAIGLYALVVGRSTYGVYQDQLVATISGVDLSYVIQINAGAYDNPPTGTTSTYCGYLPGSNNPTGGFGSLEIISPFYNLNNLQNDQGFLFHGATEGTTGTAFGGYGRATPGTFTSLKLRVTNGNFDVGSSLSLYLMYEA